ncbi:hypothetical protein KIPB_001046 [Kipferlia bialata]|uniref:Uncharacterized protein n=1 Tax=Kipferlia bialata TaxID=797122 RepID=A0A9K3CQ55_9EUKA|nr:hypothetical protein KIPB_001046 [Kipferlia bialata]|eukprot:g1046.t1
MERQLLTDYLQRVVSGLVNAYEERLAALAHVNEASMTGMLTNALRDITERVNVCEDVIEDMQEKWERMEERNALDFPSVYASGAPSGPADAADRERAETRERQIASLGRPSLHRTRPHRDGDDDVSNLVNRVSSLERIIGNAMGHTPLEPDTDDVQSLNGPFGV